MLNLENLLVSIWVPTTVLSGSQGVYKGVMMCNARLSENKQAL